MNMFKPYCDILTVPSIGVLVEVLTCTIVVSSTSQYPTRLVLSPEMQNLKADQCLSSLLKSSIGVINISQMDGASQFP